MFHHMTSNQKREEGPRRENGSLSVSMERTLSRAIGAYSLGSSRSSKQTQKTYNASAAGQNRFTQVHITSLMWLHRDLMV